MGRHLLKDSGKRCLCKLCKKPARLNEDHSCEFFRRTMIDATSLTADTPQKWDEAIAKLPRGVPGHWIVLFRGPFGRVLRHHLIITTSLIEQAGVGAFTVTGLKRKGCPSLEAWGLREGLDLPAKIPLSAHSLGDYTGQHRWGPSEGGLLAVRVSGPEAVV